MSGNYCHQYYVPELELFYRMFCIKLFGWQDEEITFGRYTPVVFMFSRCVLCSDADINGIVVCLLRIEICSCKVSQPLLFC
jgi:hypothetical protein